MVVIKALIWDKWNRNHLRKHKVSVREVEEVCLGKHNAVKSYRKRILICGRNKAGKKLAIVISPEDENLKVYGNGIYYVITAFEKK
jgi:hypothetical protein